MRYLIIGAGGYIGTAIARALLHAGHEVVALARTAERAATLQAHGLEVAAGDLNDPRMLRHHFAAADGIVFTPSMSPTDEAATVPRLLELANGRAFLFMSGAFLMARPTPQGEWCEDSFAEEDSFSVSPVSEIRADTELKLLQAAGAGVRPIIIRPPMIWGHGKGLQIPMMIDAARRFGAAIYLGSGLNVWSNVHVDDVAKLVLLALESGDACGIYHCVSGEADLRATAEAVGSLISLPVQSISLAEAEQLLTPLGASILLGHSCRIRAPRSRAELGWTPQRFDPLTDIITGSYRREVTDL